MKLFFDSDDVADTEHRPATTVTRQLAVFRIDNRYVRFRKLFKWAFGTSWHANLPAGLRPWTISSSNKTDDNK